MTHALYGKRNIHWNPFESERNANPFESFVSGGLEPFNTQQHASNWSKAIQIISKNKSTRYHVFFQQLTEGDRAARVEAASARAHLLGGQETQ